MMNSRSSASRNKLAALAAAAVAVVAIMATSSVAEAGRKRVVVLDFEGPRSEKFHEDLVKLIRKTHTVVPANKWYGAAEQMGAATLSDKNVKKVARKLKIDAIVEGKIEKRRDEFIIRLKLRAGKSGELIGDTIDTKAEGPRIDGRAQRDIKDELVGAIDNVESNHISGEDEDEPVASRRKAEADEEDERPAKKPRKAEAEAEEEDQERPAKRTFSKRSEDERGGDKVDKRTKKAEAEDEDKLPPKKNGKKTEVAEEEDKLPPKKNGKKTEVAEEDKLPPKKNGKKTEVVEEEDRLPPKKNGKKTEVAEEEDRLPPKKNGKKTEVVEDEDKLPPKKTAAKKTEVVEDEDKLPPKKTAPTAPTAKKAEEDKLVASKPAAKKAEEDKLVASKPAAKKAEVDEEDKLPPRKPPVKKAEVGEEDKLPPRKPPAKKAETDDEGGKSAKAKTVAARDDDSSVEAEAESAPLDAATALSPGQRVADAVIGMSLTARRMTFNVVRQLRATPPNYKGSVPVPGAMFDVRLFPLAFGHPPGQLKNLGVELLYDRVLKLNSKDPMTGAVYSTEESRFALGAVFRQALGQGAGAPVVLGSLGFWQQSFNIQGDVDIPDIKYRILAPGAGVRFPVMPKLILAADLKFLWVLSAGYILDAIKYGDASVFGLDAELGADYLITPSIFARVAGRVETIGYKFAGTGVQSNARDGNPLNQDVYGARDSYFGGILTVGYIY